MNPTEIINGVLLNLGITNGNARFSKRELVDDYSFKCTLKGEQASTTLIQKVDIGALFDGIEQDISQFVLNEELVVIPVSAIVSPDPLNKEPYVIEDNSLAELPKDDMGRLFALWQRVVGFSALTALNTELSTLDGYLTITPSNSMYYTGSLRVKYQ